MNYENEQLCFGLDIGTRTIVGVVGYKDGDEFVLVDYESREHEERAMIDGQIHDIQKVSKTIYEVKSALEKRLNISLKEVAIAAAGRSLGTQIVTVTQNYDDIQEFNMNHIQHLELEGVEKAKELQQKKNTSTEYFCVAYSVIQYYLDEYVIANLEGHKGHTISAKLIATFLPKQVIDSLYAAVERAELAVCHLTLEPIAAINAVIPEQIRLLNLALLDIGAGTSDIAITKEGSVVAYGMIPNAGDEVTETILHKYLVDFDTAEKIKKQALTMEHIEFLDILGIPQQITAKELEEVISPVTNELTKQIADKMIELNGETAPNAIFCVGGGSLMLGITKYLADHIHLPEQRVALRSIAHLVKVRRLVDIEDSPEMITPIGICMTALESKYSQFTFVHLNGQKVQLLNAKKLTILDAIVAAGIEHTAIFPTKGETLMFKLNGERQRIKGENGVPAEIWLNGQVATIHDHIQDNDDIHVELATHGKPATAYVHEYYKPKKHITLEGKKISLPLIKVNGISVQEDYCIMQNDVIDIQDVSTVRELFEALDIDATHKLITIDFNAVDLDYVLKDQDELLIDELNGSGPASVRENENTSQVNEEVLSQDTPLQEARHSQENLYIIVNDHTVILPARDTEYILAAIFDYIDFDLSKPQGIIQLEHNGKPGALTDVIHDGDILKIYWKK